MMRRRLFSQLLPWFLALSLLPIAAVLLAAWRAMEEFHALQLFSDLRARAELARQFLEEPIRAQDRGTLQRLLATPGFGAATRLTIIGADGTVWAETHEAAERMSNHADRPEVKAALQGRVGESRRFSRTLGGEIWYVAVPVADEEGRLVAVLRAAVPDAAIRPFRVRSVLRFLLLALAASGVAAGLGLYATRLVSDPLEAMQRVAQRFGEGDFHLRAPEPDIEELAELARALNRMAEQLEDRITREIRLRREREAIIGSLNEGVLALDREGRLLGLNAAAARLLDLGGDEPLGYRLLDRVRVPALERVVEQALATEGAVEAEVTIPGPPERILHVGTAPLTGEDERRIGTVAVLHDVTNLRRLERARRDFVANASHELRTPLTAIRGYAETLEEEAADDPESVRRFARIIRSHAARLEALAADMTLLARLEHLEEKGELEREDHRLADLLEDAIALCEPKARARAQTIEVVCPSDLHLQASGSLVEQAVVNLLDNAIKYSPEGGRIRVEAGLAGREVFIRVQDWGCGIEPRHLPRLFERFYRADSARSRAEGGTGLGLAIVKHVAQAHGGRVTVESAPSEGSRFTLFFPS
jgi:two-component system phosphate regulon sensor histidine kinase PhoR